MQLITQKAKRGGKATSGSMSNRMENGQILSKNVVSNADGTFTVPSQRTSVKFYKVEEWAADGLYSCTCPDFEHRSNIVDGCKHTQAVKLYLALKKE